MTVFKFEVCIFFFSWRAGIQLWAFQTLGIPDKHTTTEPHRYAIKWGSNMPNSSYIFLKTKQINLKKKPLNNRFQLKFPT